MRNRFFLFLMLAMLAFPFLSGCKDRTYLLTVNTAGDGSGTVSQQLKPRSAKIAYPAEETVVLTALPAAGSRFDHWEGDINPTQANETTIEITMDGPKTVTAYFALLPPPPSIPGSLTAQGTLRRISLSWTASTGGGLTQYIIYRSTDGVNFVQHATVAAPATTYEDDIPSPAGDGIFYHYRVTADGDSESAPSNTVKTMHGTRLTGTYDGGFTTLTSGSPYVAEGTTLVNGGNLMVSGNTKLYVLDSSTIDMEAGRYFYVYGLLRVVATSGATHATFTTHNGDGLYLWFYDSCPDYNPSDGSGTMLQYLSISNLATSGIYFMACGAKLYNVKISSNKPTGTSYFTITYSGAVGGWAILENCLFDKVAFQLKNDVRSTPFEMKRNLFRGGYYSFYFEGLNNPGVNPGQIEQNDFDGSKPAYLLNMTGSQNIPLGNNYWFGGTGTPPVPTVNKSGTTIDIDFNDPSAALSSPPAGAGPNW